MSETTIKQTVSDPKNPLGAKKARKRISMSVPTLRLQVPPLEGYKLHWMSGNPGRIQRALDAGYTFVEPNEVSFSGSGDVAGGEKGSTDLGSRISVVGGVDEQGAASRLYLMKLPNELAAEDDEDRLKQSEKVANALKAGTTGMTQEDVSKVYVKNQKTDGFTRRQSS